MELRVPPHSVSIAVGGVGHLDADWEVAVQRLIVNGPRLRYLLCPFGGSLFAEPTVEFSVFEDSANEIRHGVRVLILWEIGWDQSSLIDLRAHLLVTSGPLQFRSDFVH